MTESSISLTQSDLVAGESDRCLAAWLSDNVLHPFVNGTGVRQIYNNFAEEKLPPAFTPPAGVLSGDWAVQTLSAAAGAITTYTLLGQAAGCGLKSLGSRLGLQGRAAAVLSSEATAQILGAGVYDFVKAPNPGETRLGNAVGSAAAFGVFAAGNNMLASSGKIAENKLYTGLGRAAVGAAGGLSSLEISHVVSSLLGEKRELGFDERINAIANGAFVNVALPPIQKSLTSFVDHAYNAGISGKGIPIERYLQYERESLQKRLATAEAAFEGNQKTLALKEQLAALGDPALKALARDNPLARVKEVAAEPSKAEMVKNRVLYNKAEGPSLLGHELKHLRVAKIAEPIYKEIAQLNKANPLQAEANYYLLRAGMESSARQIESSLKSGAAPGMPESPLILGEQLAANGKTYFDNWQSEWKQFSANPKYRPQFEYSQSASAKAGETQVKGNAAGMAQAVLPAAEALSLSGRAEAKLGATVLDKGINFAVESANASKIEVLIYEKAADKIPSRVIPLERSGNTWQTFVEGLPEGTLYQYRASGPNQEGLRFNENVGLVDPSAKAVSKSEIPLENRAGKVPAELGDMPKAIAIRDSYDWKGDKHPNTPMTDTVIYELNVRGYTGGDASLGNLKGTYRGLIEKIPHLKELGVTAVELMPIMQGDRAPWPPRNPETGEPLRDSWNYNQVSYKAPDGSLAADGHLGKQVAEFKDLVRAMHANNIEVILDVVFNHTREGGADGPTINLKGLDNKSYYLLKPGTAEYLDKTGCGNTLNTNDPLTQNLIVDSLRYWAQEMRVDGFRFDLATIFKYDVDGQQKTKTAIMERIENDPVLSKTKLIAEPWGPEQYYLGRFSDKLWSEWNGDFRDTVRKFVKSDSGQTAVLAERIAGSPGWFDARSGRYSVNGVTFHDGFTMRDLVTYNQKHNQANGENNRDGSNDNFSWNSGHEGPVEKAPLPEVQKLAIEALRTKQVKNLMSLLLLSRGTPHMVAGDEMRHSTFGNNNPWNQDKLNMIDWSLKDKNSDMFRFTKMMLDLRRSHELGRLSPNSFIWHGVEPNKPDFADYTRFIAWQTRPDAAGVKPLYSAFNSYWEPITVTLPKGNWFRLVDTNLPAGQDIVAPGDATSISNTYTIQPRSGIVLEGR